LFNKLFASFQSSFSTTLRQTAAIFQPPFDGLWLVEILYIIFCYIVYPHSSALMGDLPDSDDYMYLNQILDWMQGQGWYDNIQHRLDPPNGVPIHFSRLAMLPMAALLGLFKLCGSSWQGAGILMATFYPLILFGGFFVILRWVASMFVPTAWAGVSAFVTLFAGGVVFMLRPGHIDHHGLMLLFLMFAMGCVMRLIDRPDQKRWAIYTGITLGLGQTIALEILPWLLLVSGWIGLAAIIKGKNIARQGLNYGLTLCGVSFVGLLLTRLPSDLLTIDVLTYSIVYVILAAGIALTFIGISFASSAPQIVRWIVGGGLAGVSGFLFLHHFPELIVGPYGGIDPALAQIILGEIIEAQPYKTAHISWFELSRIIVPTIMAIGINLYLVCAKKTSGNQRWHWSFHLLLLSAAFALAIFYQRRFVAEMDMLVILPMTFLLHRGWVWIGTSLRGRPRVYAEIGLILLVGPLPAILYPAMIDGRTFATGMMLFGAHGADPDKCQMVALEKILRDRQKIGDQPLLIMNPLSSGPELLFRTRHSVLAAPFHMDVDGNVDSMRFFSTPYPEEAEAIARRRHIGLVVTCRSFPEVYVRLSPSQQLIQGDNTKDFAPHFIERLMLGKVPGWLKPVLARDLVNYAVYTVDWSAPK
jgi:hypothetical protein